MAVTLNKANLVLKDANGNIGKIEQLSNRDLAKIRTAVSDVALVVNQSNHKPIVATTTNKGMVQLATSADVVSGAFDKVVTAEQLHNATKTIALVTGEIKWFAFSTVPVGYLVCNGANVSRATYADLFAVIGTTFGSGDGSTTFTLPNLIDKFAQGSATVGTVKSAGLPNITGSHSQFIATHTSAKDIDTYGAITVEYGPKFSANNDSGINYGIILGVNASKSNAIYGNSSTVQPPALTLLPCIKY